MAQEADPSDTPAQTRRKLGYFSVAMRVLVLVGLGSAIWAWSDRERIAHDVIAQELDARGIAASYEVTEISTTRQVLSNIVIGDPDRPDLTVERVEILILPRVGLPGLEQVRLIRPRLYGELVDGQISLGQLDALIYGGEDAPFEFPDLDLVVDDGRGLIESDYGRLGVKLSGAGHLRGGFAGELAVSAPQLAASGCTAQSTTLYGKVTITSERPSFSGPLRFDSLNCENGLVLGGGGIALEVMAQRNLADLSGTAGVKLDRSRFGGAAIAALEGKSSFSLRDGLVAAEYDFEARDLSAAAGRMATLQLDGRLRAPSDFARIESEGRVEGAGLRPGSDLDAALAQAAEAGAGTLLEPLLVQIRRNLGSELTGAQLAADYTLRTSAEQFSLVVPQGELRGRSGSVLLALSRAQMAQEGDALPFFDGNFSTGGRGLPQLTGRMEQAGSGPLELNLSMRDYTAGGARLSLPELRVEQSRGGTIRFAGRASASGAIPGGSVQGLQLPLDGTYSPDGTLSLWSGCRDVRFDALQLASLAVRRKTVALCPQDGRPILRAGANGVEFAAGLGAFDLAGELSGSPFTLATGPVQLSWPGTLTTSNVDLALGEGEDAVRFSLGSLDASFQSETIGGSFAGADAYLPAVPLDLGKAAGDWSFADGVLALSNLGFSVTDRQDIERFEPLVANGATLVMEDSIIRANAMLREPITATNVARVDIVHDLGTATGHADLAVDGLTFSRRVQPQDLTFLAKGVVSNVRGTVTGSGRIDWNPQDVTSSGRFASDGMDVDALFGQVDAASGEIVFTDLLGMTTAPGQVISIGTLNPGIEMYDGEVSFQLVDGEQLILEKGEWPFLGGTLRMKPLIMNIGASEKRTYEVVIEGLEAAQFIQRMELNNLAATGTFDGSIPIVFDESGNGSLEGGVLRVRPPGGNLAYVGQLTYEDLSAVGNFAFQTLRDLEFREAEIFLNGSLTGELVTEVRFDGVGQGGSAKRNFLTREIAKLPIQLKIRISAPFTELITLSQRIYDPTAVLDAQKIRDLVAERDARRLDGALPPSEPVIQPAESEPVP